MAPSFLAFAFFLETPGVSIALFSIPKFSKIIVFLSR